MLEIICINFKFSPNISYFFERKPFWYYAGINKGVAFLFMKQIGYLAFEWFDIWHRHTGKAWTSVNIVYTIFRSKYDELESALLTVECLMPALASLWNASRQGPHSLGKHYPLFYARLESFLHGNRPRQQSLITLLGSQACNLSGTYKNSTTCFIHCYRQKALVSK